MPGEISDREVRAQLDAIVLKAVPPVAVATAILYAVLGVADWLWLPTEVGAPLSMLCGATAIVLFGLCVALALWRPPPAAGHPLLSFVGVCILVNSLASLHLSGDHQQTLFVMLLILAAGIVFKSVRWLVGMIVVCLAGWVAVVLAAGELPSWTFYLTILAAAVFLSVTLHTVRLRTTLELIELQQSEKRQREKLQRSNRDLEAFAYTVSHDLKEPLRTITGFLSLLKRRHADEMGDEAKEFLRHALDGASRMETMIADVLTYSRVGGGAARAKPVSVREAVDVALEQLRSAIERSGAEVTVPEDLPTVEMELTDLVRLLQNLLFNAIRYRSKERTPEIRLEVEREGELWRFSVSDNGAGMETDDIDRLFGLFQRSNEREDDSGTGVGLAVCRKIVGRYGGKIWAESERGIGSTFFFTLPA